MMQTHLTIPLFGLFIITVIVIFAIILLIYRRTNPVVSTWTRALLITIRSLALVLLLLVLFQARLQFTHKSSNEPVIAIAIDNSASMSVTDTHGNRREKVSEILSNPVFGQLSQDHQLAYYSFAGKPVSLGSTPPDSLTYTGDQTDLSDALQFIHRDQEGNNLSAIIMLTDGSYNTGGNPVRSAPQLNVPIYPIPVGSEKPVPDISMDNLTSNPFTYIDVPTPVTVTLHSVGFAKLNLPVTLMVNDSVYSTTTITLPPSPAEIKADLEFMAQSEGMKKLTCIVPGQGGELSLQNNSKTIYLDVLKAKLNVCLIAGAPVPEISFFKRHITAMDRYQVNTFVQQKNGRFYENEEDFSQNLQDSDILILMDFPTSLTPLPVMDALRDRLKTKHTPVWLVYGKNLDINQLRSIDTFLPVKAEIKSTDLSPIVPQITINGRGHPVIMATREGERAWQKLPPAYTRAQFNTLWPGSEVLADSDTGFPLIVIRNANEQKSAALLAFDTWRWDLLMYGVNNNDNLYGAFIQNMLRWLEIKKETDWVRILTDKQKYTYGSNIRIDVEVINKDVITDYKNELVLSLEHNGESEKLIIPPVDSTFSKTIIATKPGDYKIKLLEPSIPSDKCQPALYSVGDYSAEMADTRMQQTVLQELAKNSNGFIVSPDSLEKLDNIKGEVRELASINTLDLWNHKIILGLIILFLSLEWFLRKRFGML